MNKYVLEFRDFIFKQNALALAIGVIIGASFGKVVSGLVDDVIMPLIGVVLPGGEWRNAQWILSGTNAIKYGDLLGRMVDFTLTAFVIFLITKAFIREQAADAAKA